jgi:hypothetical protein
MDDNDSASRQAAYQDLHRDSECEKSEKDQKTVQERTEKDGSVFKRDPDSRMALFKYSSL